MMDDRFKSLLDTLTGYWVGHALRGEKFSYRMVALGWPPEGNRAVARRRTTWRRTVEAQMV